MSVGRRAFVGGAIAIGCTKSQPRASSAIGRIVSISPSTTETVCAIGARDLLVGRSRYCDFPPDVAKLPQVGGYVDPSFEAILALRPDLVTGARGPAGDALAKKLDARGIATYFPPTESFAAIDAMIAGMGERTLHPTEARATIDRIAARVREVEDAVKASPRVKVLLVFGLEPLAVAGPSSFADEMIRRAGGENVIRDGGGYPTISVEHVFALDPDVIVNAAIAESHGLERLGKDSPGWAKVRAVADDRVAPIADESVLRPGPRVGDGLAKLAKALHPRAALR
jgi:iron complex transport system substrate-binding protein